MSVRLKDVGVTRYVGSRVVCTDSDPNIAVHCCRFLLSITNIPLPQGLLNACAMIASGVLRGR
jgi:hypothetical protein